MADNRTIDELAREAGTTTRNVRAYQTRGVLNPPQIINHIGYYTDEHLTRLKLISRLQQRGFGLQAINDLLSAHDTGSSLSEMPPSISNTSSPPCFTTMWSTNFAGM